VDVFGDSSGIGGGLGGNFIDMVVVKYDVGGGGGSAGGGGSPTPQDIAYPLARDLAAMVNGGILGDCQALALFADEMAGQMTSNDAFVQAFGVFVDLSDFSVQRANSWGLPIAANTDPVIMLRGGGPSSGFAASYQESVDHYNIDQTHHFAAYFQVGYYMGMGPGSILAVVREIRPRNPGDIRLGIQATMLGDYLRAGASPFQIGDYIRAQLCE
jgi:hypothetical protein